MKDDDSTLSIQVVVKDEPIEKINVTTTKGKDVLAQICSSAKVLEWLANDESDLVKQEVALNRNISHKLMKQFAQSQNTSIACSLAQNRSLLESIMKELAKSEDWRVRIALAHNPSLTPRVLRMLAKDDELRVVFGVINNDSVTKDILDTILDESTWPEVRVRVREKRETINQKWVKRQLENDALKEKRLRNTTADDRISVKVFFNGTEVEQLKLTFVLGLYLADVSKNNYVLAILAKNRSQLIRERVASNRAISNDIFEYLAKDESTDVVYALAKNENLPVEIAETQLVGRNWFVTKGLLENPNLQLSTLVEMIEEAHDDETILRIMDHSNMLSRSTLEILAEFKKPQVRRMAESRLRILGYR